METLTLQGQREELAHGHADQARNHLPRHGIPRLREGRLDGVEVKHGGGAGAADDDGRPPGGECGHGSGDGADDS